MERTDIKRLNASHRYLRARFFSADQFRRRNRIEPKVGLCAGLVQVWWSCVRVGHDGLDSLKNASPDVVADVRLRQARSYSWPEFSEDPINVAGNEELMGLKYEGRTWPEVRTLCRACGIAGAFELDLMLQHEARIVRRHEFPFLTVRELDVLATDTREGLRLIVLRYRAPTKKSGRAGHRLAFVKEQADVIRFFDPNCGEMVFHNVVEFGSWLLDFWEMSGYSAHAADPIPDVPSLRVFQFDSTFWTATRPDKCTY